MNDSSIEETRVARMLHLLDLEEVDANLYRAQNPPGEYRNTLYGGQVAAQALRAAALTVPAERQVHSLHGYFLRPGRADHPIILHVHRDRDGRSFSARHVNAVQYGEVIFSMSASFHIKEPGGSYDASDPAEPVNPERFPPLPPSNIFWDGFDIRVRPEDLRVRAGALTEPPSRMWARTEAPLPDEPIVHACLLTYFSDNGSGFGTLEVEGLPSGGPSLDHAVWFHRQIRMDRWVQLEMKPTVADGGRGVYSGAIYDSAGVRCVSLAQEALLRLRRPPPG
jgi:acyl-CoA thioesterase-2